MTNWDLIEKGGITGGWEYNESNLEYDQIIDQDSQNYVFYNGVGVATVWSNIAKTISLLVLLVNYI